MGKCGVNLFNNFKSAMSSTSSYCKCNRTVNSVYISNGFKFGTQVLKRVGFRLKINKFSTQQFQADSSAVFNTKNFSSQVDILKIYTKIFTSVKPYIEQHTISLSFSIMHKCVLETRNERWLP